MPCRTINALLFNVSTPFFASAGENIVKDIVHHNAEALRLTKMLVLQCLQVSEKKSQLSSNCFDKKEQRKSSDVYSTASSLKRGKECVGLREVLGEMNLTSDLPLEAEQGRRTTCCTFVYFRCVCVFV